MRVPILVAKAVRRALGEAGGRGETGSLREEPSPSPGASRLSCRSLAPRRGSRQGDPACGPRGTPFLRRLRFTWSVVLIARAMPPLSLLQASDRRDLAHHRDRAPHGPPRRGARAAPAPPRGGASLAPSEQTERAPDAPPRVAHGRAGAQRRAAERPRRPRARAREPLILALPRGRTSTSCPTRARGACSASQARVSATRSGRSGACSLREAPAGAPASTVAPAARPVDSDIAGKVVRNEMAKRDKELGLDAPLAGSMASAVQAAVMGSDIPASGTRGSITCNVSPSGVVSGCKLTTSTGGGSVAWNNAPAVRPPRSRARSPGSTPAAPSSPSR